VVSGSGGSADAVKPDARTSDALNPGGSDPEAYYPGAARRAHPGPEGVTNPGGVRDG
jgi:hypothetical protein